MIEGTEPPHLERIDHGGHLPDLPAQMINLYGATTSKNVVHDALADLLRRSFGAEEQTKLRAV